MNLSISEIEETNYRKILGWICYQDVVGADVSVLKLFSMHEVDGIDELLETPPCSGFLQTATTVPCVIPLFRLEVHMASGLHKQPISKDGRDCLYLHGQVQ